MLQLIYCEEMGGCESSRPQIGKIEQVELKPEPLEIMIIPRALSKKRQLYQDKPKDNLGLFYLEAQDGRSSSKRSPSKLQKGQPNNIKGVIDHFQDILKSESSKTLNNERNEQIQRSEVILPPKERTDMKMTEKQYEIKVWAKQGLIIFKRNYQEQKRNSVTTRESGAYLNFSSASSIAIK